jgi:hypothetical protein
MIAARTAIAPKMPASTRFHMGSFSWNGYWQAYEEGKCEYPAEVFPKALYGYDASFQSTQI